MKKFLIIISFFCISFATHANKNVTDLKNNAVQKWEHKTFAGETRYSIVNYNGKRALKAISEAKASGLILKQKIDLQATPFISWSWLAEKKLPQMNERNKDGDDFAARVYLVIDGGLLKWNSKSVSYVWSSNQAKGQVWNNPFVGANLKMVAIRGKEDKLGQWYNEKRNVYQDLIKQFGDKGSAKANLEAYRFIDVVALMTDTDNSKSAAESYYGDIVFTAK